MSKPDYQKVIDGMAEEFRLDTIDRLESINHVLRDFQVNEDNVMADFTIVKEQIHSIKGTAGTFGFHALSHVAYALNAWIHSIAADNPEAVSLHDPAFADDLRAFVSLMLTITRAKDRQAEQQGVDALSQSVFSLYGTGS